MTGTNMIFFDGIFISNVINFYIKLKKYFDNIYFLH